MKVDFERAFDRVMGNEGGFQSKSSDRGNWTSGVVGRGELKGTKFGISAMSYPHLDIKNLTKEQAKGIYYEDWWVKLGMDLFRPSLSYQMFDAALNHGMGNATRMLQRGVKVLDDGVIGPRTRAAVDAMPLDDMLMRFLSERLRFMTQIGTWKDYGKGWAVRIADNLIYAAEDTP
jgi:lysozyme family protein